MKFGPRRLFRCCESLTRELQSNLCDRKGNLLYRFDGLSPRDASRIAHRLKAFIVEIRKLPYLREEIRHRAACVEQTFRVVDGEAVPTGVRVPDNYPHDESFGAADVKAAMMFELAETTSVNQMASLLSDTIGAGANMLAPLVDAIPDLLAWSQQYAPRSTNMKMQPEYIPEWLEAARAEMLERRNKYEHA